MDVVIFLLATPLVKLICRVVLFAFRCFPVRVTVWTALPYAEVRDGEQIQARMRCTSDEMYFLFSVVSSFIWCPHVHYTIPALQCVKHALHLDFGSTSTISHSSVFPAAIIASFESLLKGLNA